jgi:hypothetical protein
MFGISGHEGILLQNTYFYNRYFDQGKRPYRGGHATAFCVLSLPDPQHEGNCAWLAALFDAGDPVLCAKPVVGFCFVPLVATIAVLFGTEIWRFARVSGHLDIARMLSVVLPLIPAILLLALAADVVLRDFMLPHYALEDATAG